MKLQKHAYLVMAHNQWNVLKELLSALDDPRNDIYLHIDAKASPPREQIAECVRESKLVFTKQYSIVWGGTQMMECTLSMLTEAAKEDYAYYHFISGSDFPIKSQDYIHSYFTMCQNQEFIGFDWPGIESGRFIDRVSYYHFLINIIGKRDNCAPLHRILEKVEDLSLTIQKKIRINRLNYTMYKGSSWFSITNMLANEIVKNRKQILRRYRFTANADETWLQTFVMEAGFEKQLAQSNKRYIKWVQGNPSPETLTMEDYEELLASDKIFARKFDWNKDCKVIQKLKEHFAEG